MQSPLALAVALLLATATLSLAQQQQSTVVDVTVHSPGLEHNLLGDPADQPVSIYLPAAYTQNPTQRFPVLIFLHGYSDRTPRHSAAVSMQQEMDRLLAKGTAQPMIIVLPNGINKYVGSFYANSSTTGNWDDYITRDVVGYVDQHYRTNGKHAIAGHSMGGFGALTLAFRHPDVFPDVYAMSPCCTELAEDAGPSNPAWRAIGALTDPAQVPQALEKGQFFVAAFSALDAALAPDPKAPLFGDAPFYFDHGDTETNASAYARITANMPVYMVAPLLHNIQQLHGIFIEFGAQDNFTHIPAGAQHLSAELSAAGVPHTLEVFQGDHGNHYEDRIADHLLPWVSDRLSSPK